MLGRMLSGIEVSSFFPFREAVGVLDELIELLLLFRLRLGVDRAHEEIASSSRERDLRFEVVAGRYSDRSFTFLSLFSPSSLQHYRETRLKLKLTFPPSLSSPPLQVTSSGAQCSLVIDVETQQTIATLKGHTSSVKTTIWDPSNPSTFLFHSSLVFNSIEISS